MADLHAAAKSRTQAIVLAAGHDEASRQLLVQPLAGSTVIELVLENVSSVIDPQDITIVVAENDTTVRDVLGPQWHYVIQSVPAGTGDAVRCARRQIADFDGDVLIAYGDTPLLRPTSLRGLLNRHRLKNAQFSLLTAVVDAPMPYGRINRNTQGQLLGIVETTDLTEGETGIHEINVGTYVGKGRLLIEELDAMAARGEHRLTNLAQRLIDSGANVATYWILDQDEVQGINTETQLQQAADIVLKRLFAPRGNDEGEDVHFGTGGWRAVIGEGFTLYNVRRLCQAVANEVTRNGDEERGVVIGGDRRFLSKQSAEAAAEIFAGNNIPVTLLPDDVPTPLVTFAAPHLDAAYGLIFTASHNPPEWNGLKVFRRDGSLPLQDETDRYEAEANALTRHDLIKLDLTTARAAGMVTEKDLTNDYIDAIEKIVDIDVIRSAALRVIVDPMYGTSQLTLGTILSDARARVTFIHDRHNPLFGGRSPAPDLESLHTLIEQVKDGSYDLGMATDGDADRIAIVDEQGNYISTNDLLLLIYWYLHEVRGERGGVVRNLATTHLLDRLAASFGEKSREVPVGFKHITAGMLADDAVLGGESSGGLTIRGHILGKDGIFACALVVEMLARTGRPMTELLADIYQITGRLYSLEASVPSTPDMRIEIPRKLQSTPLDSIAGYPVLDVNHMDGTKILLDHDNWALLRFSGTEPLLRMFVEADTPEKAKELSDWLADFVTAVP